MKLSWPATTLSLIGHAVLVLILVLFARPHTLPDVPRAMQAMLVAPPTTVKAAPKSSAPAVEPAPEPLPAPDPEPKIEPKPEPKVEPKVEPKKEPVPEPKTETKPAQKPDATPKAKPDPEPKPAPDKKLEKSPDPAAETKRVMDEAKRIADAAQAKQEADIRRKQQEVLAQQMQSEIDDLANSATNAALAKQQAAQLREFTLAINRKIKSQWRRPPQVSGQLSTLMRITLIPGGEVTSVIVTKSSGNEAFDASVKDAVLRASPLPVPADAAVFRDNFRIFSLNYTTEE